ncbi:MAG: succinate dehydrogenase cytochrome b subunit [Flavobacteriaceae bacterium]|nr:succinate dehydrogenase cytochrome b subunit [Flavobacteriaceae bacterium]MDZ4147312.1 succinate dehydrogenase cytochrome b subunit [Flavobacteriaceae bacterium]
MSINTQSSIGRKVLMSLSALFLLFFLFQHFLINISSVFSPDLFNELSHFMGTNPLVQFALQPVLILGVVFHFIMGFVLEIQNKKARGIGYASFNGNANSTWASRNMLVSGGVILLFLGLHFYDFWIPEINHKYVEFLPSDPTRYYPELQHKFTDIIRVILYSLSFILLALHLNHGFQSAFQSVGFNNRKYTPTLKKIGKWYSILIPLGFVFIAIFHYINQL